MENRINMDTLAEMHYAKFDPQYVIDKPDQKELEMATCDSIDKFMDTAIDTAITMGVEKGMNVRKFLENNKDYILGLMANRLDEYL